MTDINEKQKEEPFNEGMRLFRTGKYVEAKPYFTKAIDSGLPGQDGVYEKSVLFAKLSDVGEHLAHPLDPDVSLTCRYRRAEESYKEVREESYKELRKGSALDQGESVLDQEEIQLVKSALNEFRRGLHEAYENIVEKHRKLLKGSDYNG